MIAAVIGVPLRLHGHYLAFATLALALIAFALPAWDRFTGGEYGISVTKPLSVFGHDLRGPARSCRLGRRYRRVATRDEPRPLTRG